MGLRALHRPGSGASPHGSFEGAGVNNDGVGVMRGNQVACTDVRATNTNLKIAKLMLSRFLLLSVIKL